MMMKNMKLFCESIAIFFSFTVLMAISGCSDDYKFGLDIANQGLTASQTRTIDDALVIAEQAKAMLGEEANTRSTQMREIDRENVRVICKSKTRSLSSDGLDTLIYVVNYVDDEGFAIISANPATEALLGVTGKGCYDDAVAENEGLALFMEMAEGYVRNRVVTSIDPFIEVLTTLIDSLNPLITVDWGQMFPEGLYCPNTTAGCANTAAIQICSYYEYPTSMNLTFSQRERDAITINWSEVKMHQRGCGSYASHTNCSASVNSHKVIGEMARQCGVYSGSIYYIYYDSVIPCDNPAPYSYTNYVYWDDVSTFTYLDVSCGLDVVDMIESLGYVRPQPQSYTSQCTQSPLSMGRPIYMLGSDSNGGHFWVIDGYKYYQDILMSHATEPATFVGTSYRYYNHVNWGWNGISNGYFLDGVFNANSAFIYDDPSLGIASDSYNINLKYFPVVKQLSLIYK